MLVHAVIDIPEGTVVDNRLPATISFMCDTDEGPSRLEMEGYLEPLNEMLGESLDIKTINVAEDEVIIFRYDQESVSPDDALLVRDMLQVEFPDNKVLGLTSDIDFLIENADAAVQMLEKMIAHIKVMEGNQKKIVLT